MHSLSEIQYYGKISDDGATFTGLKPLLDSRVEAIRYDSLIFYKDKAAGRKRWLKRKFFRESFIIIDTNDLKLGIDPLINVAYGKGDGVDKNSDLSQNSRGLMVRGDIGPKFSFETTFLENQAFLPAYLSAFTKRYGVIPAQGRVKPFKKTGYDYAFGSGYISWSPSKLFNLQLGHGKHFVGEGYRSMLLSDNSFYYPFIKPSFQYKWIKYDVIFSSLMIMNGGQIRSSRFNEPIFRKKPGTFHLLSLKPIKQLEIGLFEGTIFKAETPGKPEDWAFANPVIFLNSALYGLNGIDNNVLAGITVSIKPVKQVTLYGQYAYDGEANSLKKAAWQSGAKFSNSRIFGRVEYNRVKTYTYLSSNTFQSYSHYHQSLTHPANSGFSEAYGAASVRLLTRLFVSGRVSFIRYTDSMTPFQSDSLTTISGASFSSVLYLTGTIEYVFNPVTNLSVFAEATVRKVKVPAFSSETGFVYFGIRTNLFNSYRDF